MNAEERAIKAIIDLMIQHKYEPGSKLQEADLAEELGMSRTPVRNALRKLVAEGLLENKPFRSCSIPILSLEDMREVFLVRSTMEALAAKEAAGKISENRIAILKDLLQQEEKAYLGSDPNLYYDINERFHMEVLEGSENSYLIRHGRPIFLRSQLYIYYYDRFCMEQKPNVEFITNPESQYSKVDHKGLVRALEEKDSEVAELIAGRHIMNTFNNIRSRLLTFR